jgi:hypothetical protein
MKTIQYSAARAITITALLFTLTLSIGVLHANNTRSHEELESLAGSPNEIDTVYFTVNTDSRGTRSKNLALQFWPRGCTACKLDGFVTPQTSMTTPLGETLPISRLRKGDQYEALAIIYSNSADGSIAQIILAESL